ncbi:MAG: hypothetical protein PHO66_05065, partial [Eubacteriales bacterium]|nr:hypothetical protein [Eubacteriales bacterium]
MPADAQWVAATVLAVLAVGALLALLRRAQHRRSRQLDANYGAVPAGKAGDLSSIKRYHIYAAQDEGAEQMVDDTTWNDLNMDDVFARINVCACSVGEEYLYHRLHCLKADRDELERWEKLVCWADKNPAQRLTMQRILAGVGKRQDNGLSFYLFHARAKRLPHAWAYPALAALPLVGMALLIVSPQAGLAVMLAAAAINIVLSSRSRLLLEGELDSMRYFAALLYGAKQLDKKLGEQLRRFDLDVAQPLKPLRHAGGLVPGGIHKAMAELEALVLLFKAVFLVDLVLYNRTVALLTRHTQALGALYRMVGELDAAVCVASYRRSLTLHCKPTFHADNTVDFSQMYHPLLAHPVANSGRIDNDSIITGSNASGKSTFLKAIAVNHILAQTIHTCCAARYALGFAYVASSMAVRDDILTGDSYFITEIKSLKRIMEYCRQRRCLCLIDEILRGTNTPERLAASTAVLRQLHGGDSLCLVASHDIELTHILAGVYDSYHFSEKFENDTILFDYLLKDGPSRSRNAIRLLEYMGFDRAIVEEAL